MNNTTFPLLFRYQEIFSIILIILFTSTILNAQNIIITPQVVELASKGNLGKGNDDSFGPSISFNGNLVGFYSSATNLVPGDSQASFDYDYFIVDRERRSILGLFFEVNGEKIPACSLSGYGCQIYISGNGQYALIWTDTPEIIPPTTSSALYRVDLIQMTAQIVSIAPDGLFVEANEASISENGRYIAFTSYDSPSTSPLYWRDINSGITKRISIGYDAQPENDSIFDAKISPDGDFVAFSSSASNLVPGDTNGFSDIFLRQVSTNSIVLISKPLSGGQSNQSSFGASVDRDGKRVAFFTRATNLSPNIGSQNFVFERGTQILRSIPSPSTSISLLPISYPIISANGSRVGFSAGKPVNANGDPVSDNPSGNIFLYDFNLNRTFIALALTGGNSVNGSVWKLSMDEAGNTLAFQTFASNIISTDIDNINDIIVYSGLTPPQDINNGSGGNPGSGNTKDPNIIQIKDLLSQLKSKLKSARKPIGPDIRISNAKKKKIKTSRKVVKNISTALKNLIANHSNSFVQEFNNASPNWGKEFEKAVKNASNSKLIKADNKKRWDTVSKLLREVGY